MIEKSGTSGTTIFMQDEAGHLIGEYTGGGSLIEETVYVGDIPVATLIPNGSGGVNIFYVHTDQLNTPRKIAQPSSGTLAWRWDSDPFGTTSPNENPAGLGTFVFNLRYPGQYSQSETGLSYNYLRDYDPQVGRYLESDPIGQRGGINTYAYAREDAISRSDPSGLVPCELVDGRFLGISAEGPTLGLIIFVKFLCVYDCDQMCPAPGVPFDIRYGYFKRALPLWGCPSPLDSSLLIKAPPFPPVQ
jgi:RHS repeat-associated protein